ncbi:MAG: acyl-CoA dehydrogenase [Pseudonocardiaceae bacterium]|nr:acyl-CoA dehydrogenase [Pseudonocardiaceae bacterium]
MSSDAGYQRKLDAVQRATLTPEQQSLQESLRQFMNREVEPLVAGCEDTGIFPRQVLPGLVPFGPVGGILPETSGGQGLSYTDMAVLMEETGYHWMSLRSTLSVITMVALILDRAATDQQRAEYLAPLLRGQRLCWFGITEPDHGSDVRGIETTAVPDGDGYVINGTKLWITNGAIGDFGVLLAKVKPPDGTGDEGLTAFLIDPRSCEFEAQRVETMFLKATTTSELSFAGTRVSADALLGKVGEGGALFLTGLDLGRLNVAMGAVGAAQRALDTSIRYATDRTQFGKRIAEFQLVQQLVADMRVKTAAARSLGYAAARVLDTSGVIAREECAIAKLFATETAFEVANNALQVHGAMGTSKEYGLERVFRDARGGMIVEGTSQVQRLVIAREQLGISAFV